MKKLLAFLMLYLAFSLSACLAFEASTRIEVELNDFTITPHQFSVAAGSEITIKVTNRGSVVHDFTIMKYGVDVGDQFDDGDRPNIYWEVILQPGETETFTVNAPDLPGIYQIVCALPGHLESGMQGTLEVVQ